MSARRRTGVSRTVAIGALIALFAGASPGAAEPARHTRFANESALTVAPGRVEVGVFSEASLGLSSEFELRLHPLAFFAFPHAEVKWRLWDADRVQWSSRHRVSYPTLFLGLVSREGTGGLLPKGTGIPQALLVDQDLLFGVEPLRNHWLGVEAGASVAPRSGEPEVLLDFPFLYQRLAALHAPLVPRVGLTLNGNFTSWFGYALSVRQRWLLIEAVDGATSTDLDVALHVEPFRDHRFGVEWMAARARFPVGERTHSLPLIDYRIAF